MAELQCIVVTPERTVVETAADFVALTLFDGEIGILPMHAPMIGRLGVGEMRIDRDSQVDRYYIEGGFVQVIDDVVSVLTSRAILARELDSGVVREQLAEAMKKLANTPELMATRDRSVSLARAQLRVAQKS